MNESGDIRKDPLWEDIKSIVEGPDTGENFHFSAVIHTVKEDFPAFKVLEIQQTRNYWHQTAEFMVMSFMLAAGDYVYRLYPYRDNLELTLKKTWLTTQGVEDPERPPELIRYKAIFLSEKNPRGTNDPLGSRKQDDLNRLAPLTVYFELQDRWEEVLRNKTVSGIYYDITGEDLIRALTVFEASQVKVDGKPPVEVVDIVEPDNKEKYEMIMVPSSNLKVQDLPGWLQERADGLYNAGVGSFFQRYKDKSSWFVYPLYNYERYNKESKKKLLIYGIQPFKLPNMDITYRVEGNIIYALSTSEQNLLETAYNTELNRGVGFRMPDGNAMMLKPVEIKAKGTEAKRKRLNHEFANYERPDQMPFSPKFENSSNPYHVMSKVLQHQLVFHTVTWQHGDTDQIYPGMPCRYVFYDREERVEVDGTILFCFSVTALQGNPLEDRRHTRTAQLGLMLKRWERKPETPPDDLVFGDET